MRQHVGIVGIQHERARDVFSRLVKQTAIQRDATEHDLHHRVTVIEIGGPFGELVRQALFLVPLHPRLATPVVEVGQRQPE